MPELLMPKRIVYGKNSLNKIRTERHEHTVIISDGGFLESRGFIHKIDDKARKTSAKVSRIIDGNPQELYRQTAELHFADEIDSIIAVGGAGVIDCGMLLSGESGAEFIAVPAGAACGMTDFETGRYYEYRNSPDCVILDPQLMHCVSSGSVAYDGMCCLAYAMDSLSENSNPIIHSLAYDSAKGILRNIVPAFRGNMYSLERLMYSMYLGVAAHRNTAQTEKSLFTKTAEFFEQFGYSKSAVLAVCLPAIAEYEKEMLEKELFWLAVDSDVARSDDGKDFVTAKMLDELRSIQATLSIPRSISGFGLNIEDFNSKKYKSDVPADLLDLCFNGSFKFVKL